MNKACKRLLSTALALIMILALIPMTSAPAAAIDTEITMQPEDSYVYTPYADTVFTIRAQGENLTFNWYYNGRITGYKDTIVPKAYIKSGYLDSTVTFPMADGVNNTNDKTRFWCVVSGNGGKVTSDTVYARIMPVINLQPDSCTVKAGEEASFCCKASGVGLSYQWVRNGSDVTGATSCYFSFTMTSALDGCKVWCRVTDKWGHVKSSRSVTATEASKLYPKITKQPRDQYASSQYETETFTITAEGEGLTFTWYWTDGPTTKNGPYEYPKYLTHSTANSSSMDLYMFNGYYASLEGTKVYCKVTNEAGYSVISDAAVARIRPKILEHPLDAEAKEGEEVTFSCKATCLAPKLQWYICPPGKTSFEPMKGKTSTVCTFTMTEEYASSYLYCLVTDYWGHTQQSGCAVARMTAPEKIETVDLTFSQTEPDQSVKKVNLSSQGNYTVSSCTGWQAADGSTSGALKAGKYYTFRVTLDADEGYRFGDYVRVHARSDKGFWAYTTIVSQSPKELIADVGFYAGMSFMYQPPLFIRTDNVGDYAEANAKVCGNNGSVRYLLYNKNAGEDDEFVEANTTGSFRIKAKSFAENYYIVAEDSADGTEANAVRLTGRTFVVVVDLKEELTINSEPEDIGLNYLGEFAAKVVTVDADGEGPLYYQLIDEDNGGEVIDEGESASLFVPADRLGTYHVVVTDALNNSLSTDSFSTYILERSVVNEVNIYLEEPVGGAPEKIVLLDEDGEEVEIPDGYTPDYPEGEVYKLTNWSIDGVKVPKTFVAGNQYNMSFNLKVKDEYYYIGEGKSARTAWRFTEDTKFFINGQEIEPESVNAQNAFLRVSYTAVDPSQAPAKPKKVESVPFKFSEPIESMPNTSPAITLTADEPGVELISDPVWARQGYAETHVEKIYGFNYFRPGETYWFTASFRLLDGYKFSKDVLASAIGDWGGEECAVSWRVEDGVLLVEVRFKMADPEPYSDQGSTIYFETNGGSPVGPWTYPAGTPLQEPDMPVRRDYRFDGWYRDEELTERFSFKNAVMPDRDICLFAKWTENKVKILRLSVSGQEDPTNIPLGAFKVHLDVQMTEEEAGSVWVILACYDAEGRLVGLKFVPLKKSGDDVYSATLDLKNDGNIARVSVMILSNDNTRPLSEVMSLISGAEPWDDSLNVPEAEAEEPIFEPIDENPEDDGGGSGNHGGGNSGEDPIETEEIEVH